MSLPPGQEELQLMEFQHALYIAECPAGGYANVVAFCLLNVVFTSVTEFNLQGVIHICVGIRLFGQ
jgi:hypothetical protein